MQIYLLKVYVLLVQMMQVTRGFLLKKRSVIVTEEGGAKSFFEMLFTSNAHK